MENRFLQWKHSNMKRKLQNSGLGLLLTRCSVLRAQTLKKSWLFTALHLENWIPKRNCVLEYSFKLILCKQV
ncbi:hypothetical protein, partial [Paenibacillus sp. S29]|uniref:hypothetical protein n=1 Tax=Paenibacillus sp. S29 TaxID=3394611 RepID=UPI003AE57568